MKDSHQYAKDKDWELKDKFQKESEKMSMKKETGGSLP